MEEKISNMQLLQMENRLKKLEDEERKAQQLIEENQKWMKDLDQLR